MSAPLVGVLDIVVHERGFVEAFDGHRRIAKRFGQWPCRVVTSSPVTTSSPSALQAHRVVRRSRPRQSPTQRPSSTRSAARLIVPAGRYGKSGSSRCPLRFEVPERCIPDIPKDKLLRRRSASLCNSRSDVARFGLANPTPIGNIDPVVLFSRYVALGDSFTEGIGDPHPTSSNGLRGWADRVATHLAQRSPQFRYANLAVRGRTMDGVLADQIQAAVMLEPDLITICAGINDLLTVRTDLDAMMARYAEGLKTLQQTGALVMVFTAADLRAVPLFRRLRGRAAIYNELLRDIAEDLGVQLVDFWRFTE